MQAAIVAYEQSERYALAITNGGGSGVGGLQSRAKSLLAAMNALRLVRKEYQWILAPSIAEAPVRDAGEEVDEKVIVELSEMERAYASVHALIQLVAKDPGSAAAVASGPMPSPANLVALLMQAGLIETSLRIVRVSYCFSTRSFNTASYFIFYSTSPRSHRACFSSSHPSPP